TSRRRPSPSNAKASRSRTTSTCAKRENASSRSVHAAGLKAIQRKETEDTQSLQRRGALVRILRELWRFMPLCRRVGLVPQYPCAGAGARLVGPLILSSRNSSRFGAARMAQIKHLLLPLLFLWAQFGPYNTRSVVAQAAPAGAPRVFLLDAGQLAAVKQRIR